MRRAATVLVALLTASIDGFGQGSRAASVSASGDVVRTPSSFIVDTHAPSEMITASPHRPDTPQHELYARAPLPVNPITFNYTFTDMSPMLSYKPSSAAAIDVAWNNWFSESSPPTTAGSSVYGRGVSAHSAAVPNSYFTYAFVGTGVYFFGETRDPSNATSVATDASILIAVDGLNYNFKPLSMPDNLLAFKDKLTFGYHTVSFYLNGGIVSLRNISVLTELTSEAPSFDTVKKTETQFYDGTKVNPAFAISGDWFPVGSIGGDANTASEPIPVLNGRAGASLTYSVPANSTYLVINGVTQPTNAYYSVSISPSPPGNADQPFSGNALQGFSNPAAFFITPLDPTQSYNLSLAVRSDTTGIIGLQSIVTYSSVWTNDTTHPGSSTSGHTSPTSSSGSSTASPTSSSGAAAPSKSSSIVGPVVGGVVGGVAGLLLLALAIFLCLRRKKKTVVKHRPDDDFVIDDDVQATPYPYEMTERERQELLARQRMSQFSDASTTPLTDPVPYPPGSRSFEQGRVIQGYVPSPASPTLTASTMLTNTNNMLSTTNMLGLGVVNGDAREDLMTNPRDPAMASYNVAAQKRAAALRAAQDPVYPPQERDAGRWDVEAEDAVAAMKTVPPSYDPSWAGDFSEHTGTVAGTVVDEPISADPSATTIREEDSQRTVDRVEELDEDRANDRLSVSSKTASIKEPQASGSGSKTETATEETAKPHTTKP